MLTREEIIVSLVYALYGFIYPSIRMVVYKYDKNSKDFTLRYYLDREPNEDDYDNISDVMGEFTSSLKATDYGDIFEECIYSTDPMNILDILDGYVYGRKED